MAQIDLGKLKFTWKGTWSTTSAYEVDDVVFYNGSSYICIVDAANTTDSPEQNTTNWAVMQRGINYVGDWSSSTSYYRGDVVLYNSTAYIMDSDSVSPLSGTNYTPGTTASTNHWKVLSTGTAGTYAAPGDLEYRGNAGSNLALNIGTLGSSLIVENDPKESFVAGSTAVYEQVQLPGATPATDGKSAYLFNSDHPTPESVTYTVTVAGGKFVINGTSQLALTLKTGSTYTFDVSDATNATHVLAFNARSAATSPTFDFETGAVANGVTRSGTPGQAGATVTWVVPHLGQLVYEYYCTNHSGMGAGITWTSSTKITGRLLHSDSHPTIDLTRGNHYTFTFPTATGMTYSIKDQANHSKAGTNGRITAGVTPDFAAGGSISFVPSDSTPHAIIRDEGLSADEINITLNSMFFKPKWSGAQSRKQDEPRDLSDTAYNDPSYNVFANHDINNYTESILPLPGYLKNSGRGFRYGTTSVGYRQGGIITRTRYTMWGNMLHNGSNGYYYGAGVGGGTSHINTADYRPWGSNWRCPKIWMEALAGNSDYAHFLTGVDGNDLGYLNAAGEPQVTKPRLKQVHKSSYYAYHLYENGIVTFAGYGGYGSFGNGRTGDACNEYACVFHDESGTRLTGSNYPKIKQLETSNAHTGDHGAQSYYSQYMIDTDGFLYTMGYNGYGQLGNNTTSSNYYFKRIPKASFNGADIIYVHTSGYYYTSTYAIDSTGKLWGWGRNNYGQLGLGNTNDQTTPQEITNVAGSQLLGKKVIHLQANQDDDDQGKCWVLTDEGKLYFFGYLENYGYSTGYYDSTNTTAQTMPQLLTNSSTLWNSNDQKVVYFVTNNNRYSTLYIITDGGSTGATQKLYATGDNAYAQQGTATSTSSGVSSSTQGTGINNWFGKELQFRDLGQDWNDQSNQNIVNESFGNWDSFQTGGSNAGKMVIGKIVKIMPKGYSGENANRVVLIDEYGQLFAAGYWNYQMFPNTELDNESNMRSGPADNSTDQVYSDSFYPINQFPGKVVDYCHVGPTNSENAWHVLTDAGVLYVGGDSSWSQNGHYYGGYHGFWRYQWNLGGNT